VKHLLTLGLICAFSACVHAQAVDATVCDILKNPASFNGKIVRVKGTVSAGFDQFIVKGAECGQKVDGIWLSYPEGSKAKSGPEAILQLQPAQSFSGTVVAPERAPVVLDKSKDFKQFDSLLSTPFKSSGMCLGCTKFEVNATLVGRLDGAVAGLTRDKTGKIVGISGFGNLNAYSARLVLQSVSEVTPQEIDYSKVASVIKADPTLDSGGSNPVAEAHKAATAFGPGNPLGNQIERAANAFGKEGDNNGVEIAFGGVNEASARSEQKGERNSPDGVLFNCIFDSSRLKGDALSRAIVHMGQHVADLRSPAAGAENAHLYELEFQAWGTTTFSAIGGRQKTFTLPGGYLVWNADWPKESMDTTMTDTLHQFLAKQALLSR